MPHYPEQRLIARLTVIQRDVLLPEEVAGVIETVVDKRVDIRDVIARGVRPGNHIMLNVAKFFKKTPEKADELILVEVNDEVEEITPIAGKSADRGRRMFSPVKGRVAHVGGGYVIIEERPEVIALEAGIRGRITAVKSDRGVTIETVGAAIQGVWGNGKRSVAVLRMEPEDGIESIYMGELDIKYMGAIVITRRKLARMTLDAMVELGIAGLIAPSMDYELEKVALELPKPVLLTEGFGSAQMNRVMLGALTELEGQQVLLDGYMARGWDTRRPEVIVNSQPKDSNAVTRPNVMLTLRPGLSVRITREPYLGQSGTVVNLLKSPILLENGLRLPCAQIQLAGGENVFVPLANLEVIGR